MIITWINEFLSLPLVRINYRPHRTLRLRLSTRLPRWMAAEREKTPFSHSVTVIAPAEIFIKICCFRPFQRHCKSPSFERLQRILSAQSSESPLKCCHHFERFYRRDLHKFIPILHSFFNPPSLSFTRLVPLT